MAPTIILFMRYHIIFSEVRNGFHRKIFSDVFPSSKIFKISKLASSSTANRFMNKWHIFDGVWNSFSLSSRNKTTFRMTFDIVSLFCGRCLYKKLYCTGFMAFWELLIFTQLAMLYAICSLSLDRNESFETPQQSFGPWDFWFNSAQFKRWDDFSLQVAHLEGLKC